ncbi:MAG: chromosome segregation protein SMC [Halobacteriales archaeon]
MHITELVLDDFKSFGRKTHIPLYEDFTTISGPNGSGKSNIIDAVLFALGLARTRGIRAEKLTDLIYNPGQEGESGGPGPKEASVEVVLDNGDRSLSREQVVSAAGTEKVGDVDEIRIKRRVKETEDNYYSYYYLNGRAVNLSDIQDLLAQAGVTPEGYNVVMQGDVTEIINMTPHQRREIIDEIAGVAQFDRKKDDALEELETVEEQIHDVELRIEEKQHRLEQLADERETALEYQGLREEKAEYEGFLKAAELEEKREDLRETEADVEDRRKELRKEQSDLDERQGKVTRLKEDLDDLNAEIERKGEDEQIALKSEIEGIKGEVDRLETEIDAAEEQIEDAEATRRDAFVKIDRKQETVEELEGEIKDVKLETANVKAEIQELESDVEAVEAEIEAVDTEYDELKATLQERKADLEERKDEKNDLQREQDRLLDEARRRSNEESEAEAELDEARERIPELESRLEDLQDELDKAHKNRENIDEVVENLKRERRERQDDLDAAEDDLQAARQEYAELEAKAEQNGDSSFPRSVTTVLESDLEGIHGTVAQLGAVEDRYATACETAAGGRMANVVVDDDGVGQRCIELLKSRNAGRGTFLPLTEMYEKSLPSPPDHAGVVDFASNLLEFEDDYAGVFSYVLGDTLVVEDLETARELMGDYRLVTLDGDLVEKSGAMTGGSKRGSRYSFSKTGKGQLERVAERIRDLQDERDDIKADIRDIEDRLEGAREKQTDAADQVRAIESDIKDVKDELSAAEDRIDDLEDELERLGARRAEVDEEMQEVEASIAEVDDEIAETEAEIDELQAELADSKIPELTDEKERLQDEIGDLEGQLDDLDGRLNELQLQKQYAEESIEELHQEIEAAQNNKAEQQERIEDLEAEIDDREETLSEKQAQVEELEAELADLKGEREDLREEVREAERARDEQRETVREMENRLESLEKSAERLRQDVADLEEVVGDYDPEEIPPHAEVKRNIGRLERQMEELEPVNMLAIEEYDDVQADLEELETGRDTLVEEADGIRERIDRYETRKRKTFMDAFESIDQQFRDIFSRLSNGTGRLHLEDEDDPFDGGLTMKARPADKPIQRLDAMSGGEKSLTALAFIFAIQRHNPAPFYALDEIDAFLDAANAERVGELVDELSANAQFVVVSHRTAMLDRSERAIGVTMQDDNVSAVTGIDLGSMEVPADD